MVVVLPFPIPTCDVKKKLQGNSNIKFQNNKKITSGIHGFKLRKGKFS